MAEHYYNPKFQSPRSGKFESNQQCRSSMVVINSTMFQSPKSGKFESNQEYSQHYFWEW